MQLGIEVLLENKSYLDELKGQRVALLGHPASTDKKLNHSIDLLMKCEAVELVCAFGPQHGMKGDKQYNMEETPDEMDPVYNIPVYSLYGDVRRPTEEMVSCFDVVLVDLQDVGCRIYTYVASLVYMIEACAKLNKSVWVLDRPNPIGRKVEGNYLQPEWKSFVGEVELPMRHGLTLGELAKWYVEKNNIQVDLKVIAMKGYKPENSVVSDLPWVNPSPQIPMLKTCRVYCGSVLLEATELSEGRGTTNPLEILGAPNFPSHKVIEYIKDFAPEVLSGSILRECFFEPFFNKHEKTLCRGLQVHTDDACFDDESFNPYRLFAVIFKAVRELCSEQPLWADFHYEYEKEKSPIGMLTGSAFLKNWVDSPESTYKQLDDYLKPDELRWQQERRPFLLY